MATPYPTASPYGPYVSAPMEPKPTTAFILSLVAGVLILMGGVSQLWSAALINGVIFASAFSWWLLVLGWIGVGLGIFVVVISVLLYLEPQHHVVYGVVILVLSTVSVVAYGGFLVGLVLGIVGGALAIAWAPYRWLPPGYGPVAPGAWPYAPPATALPSTRACLKCGRLIALDSKFCPHCGSPVGL